MAATMTMLLPLLILAAAGEPPQQRRSEQHDAFEMRRDGRLLSRQEIEARVIPGMKGAQYLGFEFDGGNGIYTLKFLRDGNVIWVDVDGRSGQVIGRTGR